MAGSGQWSPPLLASCRPTASEGGYYTNTIATTPTVVNSATVPDLCSCVFIPLELQVYIMIVLFIVIRFS